MSNNNLSRRRLVSCILAPANKEVHMALDSLIYILASNPGIQKKATPTEYCNLVSINSNTIDEVIG